MFTRKTTTTGMTFNAHDPAQLCGGPATGPTTLGAGMASGTLVATQAGWQPVDDVRVADKVLTLDGGMQLVTGVERTCLWQSARPVPKDMWPLNVPAGALGNDRDMTLMPGQAVMVKSDTGEALFDDPFTLVRAAALVGYKGIDRVAPSGPVHVITLYFETDHVVFAHAAALVYCPAQRPDALDLRVPTPLAQDPLYRIADRDEAEMLVNCLQGVSDEVDLWRTTNEALRDSAA